MKGVDKEAKKHQDQLLDIVGPLSMAFEHISSWQKNEDDSGSITASGRSRDMARDVQRKIAVI